MRGDEQMKEITTEQVTEHMPGVKDKAKAGISGASKYRAEVLNQGKKGVDRNFLTFAQWFFLGMIVVLLCWFFWATIQNVGNRSFSWGDYNCKQDSVLEVFFGETWKGWACCGVLVVAFCAMGSFAEKVAGTIDAQSKLARKVKVEVQVLSNWGVFFKVAAIVGIIYWLVTIGQWLEEFDGVRDASFTGFIVGFCLWNSLWTGVTLFEFGCVFQLLEWSNQVSIRMEQKLSVSELENQSPIVDGAGREEVQDKMEERGESLVSR